jgi:hypothetical protein
VKNNTSCILLLLLLAACNKNLYAPPLKEGTTVTRSDERRIEAVYKSGSTILAMQVEVEPNRVSSSIKDRSGRTLTTVEMPRFQSAPDARGKVVIDRVGLGSDSGESKIDTIRTYTQFSTEVLETLPDRISPEVRLAIEMHPRLLELHFERDPRGDRDRVEERIAVFENDGKCGGACGPRCGWCLCLGGYCACETNLFCELHDRYCGEWEDFFKCGFGNL